MRLAFRSMLAAVAALALASTCATAASAVFTQQRNVGGSSFTTPQSFYRAAVVEDNPVGYWHLGETTGTTAVNEVAAQNATYENGPTLGAAGATADGNTAVTFDGVNDSVNAGTIHDFPGTAAFSAEFWLKLSANPADWWSPVSAGTATAPRQGWQMSLTPTTTTSGNHLKHTVVFQRFRDGVADGIGGTTQLASGVWYHVVATYDGAVMRVYVNGQMEGSLPSTRAMLIDAAPLRFGSGTDSAFFKGEVDEVAIYDKALSDTRILTHFQRSGGYRAAVLNDRPASYWRLGETSGTTAVDEMGAVNGTYQNGPTLGTAGRTRDSNRAITLDGVDDKVGFGDRHDFPGTAPFSVEAWVRRGDSTGDYARIIGKESTGTRQQWNMLLTPTTGAVGFERYLNGVGEGVGATYGLAANTWYHVVGTYDGAVMRLYLNGVLNNQAASTLSMVDTSDPLQIGQRGNGNPFPGTVDDVAIYNHALSAARVLAHYNAGGSSCALPGTVTVIADKDSSVNQAAPTTTYGTVSLSVTSANGGNRRAVVRAPLPFQAFGCEVTTASLTLTASTSTNGRTLSAARAAADWTEAGVTWNNQPATTGAAATASSGATVTFDVASMVRAQYRTGTDYGFLIRDNAESAGGSGVSQVLSSREHATVANRPKLTVTLS